MLDVFLDSLKDSAITFGVVFGIYVLLSFIETWVSTQLEKSHSLSPLLGSLFGLLPQCGLSVVASDLYTQSRISMGTVIAVFLACSDEAIPVLLSSPAKAIWTLPLLGLKFALGAIVGTLVDLCIRRKQVQAIEGQAEKIHIGCCGHEIDDEEEKPLHKHLVHPLIHSLKIFAYVFIFSFLLSTLIFYVGEDKLSLFLQSNKYLTPFLAVLVGLIPNCAASVVLTEMFISNSLSFGALLGGLSVNAGLGYVVLLKDKKGLKKSLVIILITFLTGLAAAYLTCLVSGF
jgi:uncharacterized membrane protein YraQ (UPF0718 family)